jgi:hypothetical protein
MEMAGKDFDGHVAAVRRFNRLYTRQIGLLQYDSGNAAGGRVTLGALLDDLTRLHGPDDPRTRQVRELASSLDAVRAG